MQKERNFKSIRKENYYLNNVMFLKKVKHSLEDWQNIMGRCNDNDILKLKENVRGMQISDKNKFNSEICPQAKMSQS